MEINYGIESNSIGTKMDIVMYSLEFEEFVWAKRYQESQIEDLYNYMKTLPKDIL